ncbi:hypothetical protein ACEQPO_09280 [Bacillus sp. SL00103]
MGVSQSIYSVMQLRVLELQAYFFFSFSVALHDYRYFTYSLSACFILLTAVLVKKNNKTGNRAFQRLTKNNGRRSSKD